MAKVKTNKIRESTGDRVLNTILGVFLVLLCLIIGYPCIYVISCSFSSSTALEMGSVILWPVDFTLRAYEFVLAYKQVWIGLRNTIFYCTAHVLLNTLTTILIAYPLSRPQLMGKSKYNMFIFLTTRISAGLIPTFILVVGLGMFNSPMAVIILGLFHFQHTVILRTAFRSNIPQELYDAAMIDGASHFQTLFKIALPLAKATLSVIILYTIVGQWNEYFTSMIYLRDQDMHPLQLVLRPIMTAASAMGQFQTGGMSTTQQMQANDGLENVRYALILISTVPMLAAYAVVQKSFKGGVMVGSVKG